jgi:hypothetical protein
VVLQGILAVGAGRLLYNRPVLAVLDECTSAVDSAMEALFYQTLVDLGGRAKQPCARFTETIVAHASHVVSHTRRTSRRETRSGRVLRATHTLGPAPGRCNWRAAGGELHCSSNRAGASARAAR